MPAMVVEPAENDIPPGSAPRLVTDLEPLSQEQAISFTRQIVAATGYRLSAELEAEAIEFGWQVSAGDDVGALRVQVLRLAQLHFEFETLKMWWQNAPSPGDSLKGWVFGQSQLPPGGHLLWTPVLKARSEDELGIALDYARDMREAMLARARRWRLQPVSCRLFAMFGHSVRAEGETSDGLIWKASVKDERVSRVWDSAPIWRRVGRLFSRARGATEMSVDTRGDLDQSP